MTTLCGVMGWSGGRWVVVLLVGVLVSCSTDPGDEIVDLTTTSAVETSTSTTAATTSSSTTVVTTTTTTSGPADVPSGGDLEAIEAVVIEGRSSVLAYAYDPNSENLARLERIRTPGRFDVVLASLDRIFEAGNAVRPAEVDEESIEVLSIELLGQSTAIARTCFVTNSVTYEVETDATVDDVISAVLAVYTLVKADGQWLLSVQETLSSVPGARSCDQ